MKLTEEKKQELIEAFGMPSNFTEGADIQINRVDVSHPKHGKTNAEISDSNKLTAGIALGASVIGVGVGLATAGPIITYGSIMFPGAVIAILDGIGDTVNAFNRKALQDKAQGKLVTPLRDRVESEFDRTNYKEWFSRNFEQIEALQLAYVAQETMKEIAKLEDPEVRKGAYLELQKDATNLLSERRSFALEGCTSIAKENILRVLLSKIEQEINPENPKTYAVEWSPIERAIAEGRHKTRTERENELFMTTLNTRNRATSAVTATSTTTNQSQRQNSGRRLGV